MSPDRHVASERPAGPGALPARRRALAGLAGALLLTVLATVPALAHAELTSSDPADGATLSTPPAVITLSFSETLDPAKSSFKLLGPDGGTIGTGKATGDDVMTLSDLALGAGAYTIEWTSASAKDGDIARGKVAFTVLAAAASPSGPASPTTTAAATPTTPASVAPTAAPTPAPGSPVSSSGSDVLLPIIVGLLIVAGVGLFVLRRSRAS